MKKSKLAVEEGAATTSSTVGDRLNSSRNVVLGGAKGRSHGVLGGFDSNGDGDEEQKP